MEGLLSKSRGKQKQGRQAAWLAGRAAPQSAGIIGNNHREHKRECAAPQEPLDSPLKIGNSLQISGNSALCVDALRGACYSFSFENVARNPSVALLRLVQSNEGDCIGT
jgi:hypothetical protein